MSWMFRHCIQSGGNIRRVPNIWVFMTMVLATHAQNEEHKPPNFNARIQQALETLCPGVDICNLGANQPTILPNRVIDRAKNRISCCQGCSCHPDCQDNRNCCFQGNTTADDAMDTAMECISMQSNFPKESFTSPAPAYNTVSISPKGGCKLTSPLRSLRGFNATCDALPITPWGDLFPVYSIEQDKIYKNELCALCHGVVNVRPWQPVLICDKINRQDLRTLPLSEQLQFLEHGSQSANCFVEFQYEDKSILFGKQCSNNQISTCQSVTEENLIPTPDDLQLTALDVVKACETGAHSMVNVHGIAYRNIFCAVCSVPYLVHPFSCNHNDARTTGESTMFLLLDVDFYRKDYGPQSTISYIQPTARNKPQYCYPNDAISGIERCRAKKCPSGQIQNKDGTCQYPSKKWGFQSYNVYLKLNSPGVPSNFTGQFQQQSFSSLSYTTPWPKHWTILSIYQSSNGNEMLLSLLSRKDDPVRLIQDIRQSIPKPWPMDINDANVTFEQRFFKYRIKRSRSLYKPQWEIIAEREGLSITGMESQQWSMLHSMSLPHIPFVLTKLYVCDQIILRPGEYNLSLENMVLKSNLTRRILFDLEFELVDDDTGSLTARVCLSDTLLQTRSVTVSVYVQLEMLCVCIVICICNYLHCM